LDSGSADVLVFDPPHVPNRATKKSSKDFNDRFGVDVVAGKAESFSLRHLNAAFVAEAARVLSDQGIVLAKLCDYIHNHRYVWACAEFVADAQSAGLTACDMIVRTRKGPIMDPRWKGQHHSRRSHSCWIVLRRGRCERRSRETSTSGQP
jgi:hypothetical protein